MQSWKKWWIKQWLQCRIWQVETSCYQSLVINTQTKKLTNKLTQNSGFWQKLLIFYEAVNASNQANLIDFINFVFKRQRLKDLNSSIKILWLSFDENLIEFDIFNVKFEKLIDFYKSNEWKFFSDFAAPSAWLKVVKAISIFSCFCVNLENQKFSPNSLANAQNSRPQILLPCFSCV